MANNTVTTGAVFIPEIWSKQLIRAVNPAFVLANEVWRFDRDVAKRGDTVHVPNISNLSANDKVAGVEVSLQAVTEGEVQIVVDQHAQGSGPFKIVPDYDTDNVSQKVLRIILSYIDYVDRVIWCKPQSSRGDSSS